MSWIVPDVLMPKLSLCALANVSTLVERQVAHIVLPLQRLVDDIDSCRYMLEPAEDVLDPLNIERKRSMP